MSSISSLSSSIYVAPSTNLQSTQAVQRGGSDSDGDSDGGQKVKKSGGHGHGQMQNVLMQALQSLGLGGSTPASSTASSTATSASSQNTDSDGDSDGSTSATSSTKADMRQFMHALFQAVKSDASASTTGSSSTTGAANGNFASGLASLISQVSNGQAPADLQTAFAKVVTDLQGASGSTTAGAGTAGSTSTNPQATLQALLTQMQQNLGYGASGNSSNSSALGNIVSTTA